MTDDIRPREEGPDSPGWTNAFQVDLLVLGALTIDRFEQGRVVPGGSVLHAARGANLAGRSVAVATIAGDEPEATAGLRELEQLAALNIQRSRTTTCFRHSSWRSRRRLHLESRAGRLKVDQRVLGLARPHAVLFAPVAGEIGPRALALFEDAAWQPMRAANLQGWLRTLDIGAPVAPVPVASIGNRLAAALSALDLLVLSREDLATRADPWHQLDELRNRFGDRPILVLTDGAEGAWVDDRRLRPLRGGEWSDRWHQPVPYRVDDVPTVGAGDVLAGLLAVEMWSQYLAHVQPFLVTAMRCVADFLESRRRSQAG